MGSITHDIKPFEISRPGSHGHFSGPEILTAECAVRAIDHLRCSEVEEFWALALGPTKRLLESKMIFRGTVDACPVHPRDIFRFACLSNASSLIIVHNHPSGDRRPSEEDIMITARLLRAADYLEIPLLDHLIVTAEGFTSLAREGLCRFKKEKRR